MQKIVPSIVLSVGDHVRSVAEGAQGFVASQWPELTPVVAHAHIASNGTVFRRELSERHNLGTLTGLREEEKADVYQANFDLLCGELAKPLQGILDALFTEVRSRKKLAELRARLGLEDSKKLILHVLADSFSPVASAFPYALLRVLEERSLTYWAGFPLSVNLIYFLPGLWEEKVGKRRLARSHATFSEIEQHLFSIKQAAKTLPPPCRVWVIGSIDRNAGTNRDASTLAAPVANFINRFTTCQEDNSNQWDTQWDVELGRRTDGGRTFLTSFGFADLYFPRDYLRTLAIDTGRERLCRRLVANSPVADTSAVAADAQAWIQKVRLHWLPERLMDRREGNLIFEVPKPPDFPRPQIQEEIDRYTSLVEDMLTAALPPLIRKVVPTGDRLFEEHQEQFFAHLSHVLHDQPGGPTAGRWFCDHLTGMGQKIPRSLARREIRNIERLILAVQRDAVQSVDIMGDPARFATLEFVEIPAQVKRIEEAKEEVKRSREQLKKLSVKPTPEAEADEDKNDAQKAAENRVGTAEERHRLREEELAELTKERDRQKTAIYEVRKLARDPAERQELLDKLLEGEEKARREDRDELDSAGKTLHRCREDYKDALSRLRKARLVWAALAAAIVGVGYGGFRGIEHLIENFPGGTVFTATMVILMIVLIVVAKRHAPRLSKRKAEYREARDALERARVKFGSASRTFWEKRVAAAKKRFEFLIRAEAIRLLDRLQRMIVSEDNRIDRLAKRLTEHGQAARRRTEAVKVEESTYCRPLVHEVELKSILEDKKFNSRINDIISGTTFVTLLQSTREDPAGDVSSVIEETEAPMVQYCEDFLSMHSTRTIIDGALTAGTEEDIRNRWASVQEAARACISLSADGQGILQGAGVLPPNLSAKSRKMLQDNWASDNQADRWEVGQPDRIGAYEMLIAFTANQIGEISMKKEDKEAHWDAVRVVERE